MNRRALYITVLIVLTPLIAWSPQEGGIRGIAGQVGPYKLHYSVPGHSFFRPISIALDNDLIFVADRGDENIAVLNKDLSFSHYIGHPGEGPGEFGYLTSIDAKDGVVVASSLRPARISIFKETGELINTFPVELRQWGEIALTDDNSILCSRFHRSSDYLITEFSFEGDVTREYFPKPDLPWVFPQDAHVRIYVHRDQEFFVFSRVPRFVGLGPVQFDRTYRYSDAIPRLKHIEEYKEQNLREQGDNPTSWYSFDYHGGFDIYKEKLIVSATDFGLSVLDLDSGELSVLARSHLGELSELLISDFRTYGRYSDLCVLDDKVLLLALDSSCLIELGLDEIITAANELTPIFPLTEKN